MPDFRHVMVDIETTGLASDCNAILQIAAVKFSLDPQEVSHDFFNQCMYIPPTRWWDEGTRGWWSTMPDTLRSIYDRMREPALVMQEFYDWCGGPNCNLIFWAKPLSFDYPFVQSYFREFGPAMPFKHWEGKDLRTFLTGLNYPYAPFDDKSVPFEGVQHDGFYDTLHQINILFTALNTPKEPILDGIQVD